MKSIIAVLPLLLNLACASATTPVRPELNASLKASLPLDQGWENPPLLARTCVWWWWVNGSNDKETITRDFAAMKASTPSPSQCSSHGGTPLCNSRSW